MKGITILRKLRGAQASRASYEHPPNINKSDQSPQKNAKTLSVSTKLLKSSCVFKLLYMRTMN